MDASKTGLVNPSINGFMNSPGISNNSMMLQNIGSLPSPSRLPSTLSPIPSPSLTTLNPQSVISSLGKSVTSESYGTMNAQPVFASSPDDYLSSQSLPGSNSSKTLTQLNDMNVLKPLSQIDEPLSSAIPLSNQINNMNQSINPSMNQSIPISSNRTIIRPTVNTINPSLNRSATIIRPISTTTMSPTPLIVPSPSPISPVSVSPSLSSVSTSPSLSSEVTLPSALPTVIPPSVSPIAPLTTQVEPISPTTSLMVSPLEQLRSTDMRTNGLEFATPDGMVENQDILKMLADKGFMPFNVINTQDQNGLNKMAKYIKVIDSRGNTSYVIIDMDGNVMTQASDLTTIETTNASNTPIMANTDVLDCTTMDVCAVAMECEDGVCMLMRDNDANKKEVMLTKVEKRADEAMVESDSPIGYPVVRLSEIMQNPILVSKIIDSNTKKIRDAAIKDYISRLDKTIEARNNAIKNTNKFLHVLDEGFVKLIKDIKLLEKKRTQYDIMPPKNNKEKEEYRKINYNIRNRNDLLVNLFKISKNIDRYTEVFNELSQDAETLTNFINENYSSYKDSM